MAAKDRLKQARERYGFRSASAAARNFDWVVPTYVSHENGHRGITLDVARRYGRAFGVDPYWILGRDGDLGDAPRLTLQEETPATDISEASASVEEEPIDRRGPSRRTEEALRLFAESGPSEEEQIMRLGQWADSMYPEHGPAYRVLVHGRAVDSQDGRLKHRVGGHGWFRADSLAARKLHSGQCAVVEVNNSSVDGIEAGDGLLVDLESADGDVLAVCIERKLAVVLAGQEPDDAIVVGKAVLFWRWIEPEER